jgi:Skp family chaperone for outer membrane proteins
MHTLYRLSLTAAMVLVLATPLAAQKFEDVPEAQAAPTQATGATAGTKVGVINVQAAMARTQEGQKAAQEKVRTQERTLSEEARLQALRDIEQKRKQGTRMQEDLQGELQNAQTDYLNQIGGKMQQILDRYAREKELNLILNVAPGGPVIYATATVDITEAIIALYDQTHPVQTASGAQQPAPSQQQQQQQQQ